MRHEDGYCDGCGCTLGGQSYALRLDGKRECLPCAGIAVTVAVHAAKRPEARDDGR